MTPAVRMLRRREMLGRDGAGRGRPDVGEKAVVEKHGPRDPGIGAEQHHQAVQARQALFRIVEEAGADLDREGVEAWHIGGLHVDFAMLFLDRHGEDRRHHDSACGEAGEGPFDDRHRFQVERDAGAEFRFREDRHPRHG